MCCFIDSQDQHGTSVTTIKILLILYNIIFWVCGFGLIWFGVRLKIEMHIILMLIDAEYKEYLPFLIFYIGIILVFIVSLAFTCLIKIQKSMLFIYGNCLLIIFFVLLFLTIFLHIYKENLLRNLFNELRNPFENSQHNQTVLLPLYDNGYTSLLIVTQQFNRGHENYLNYIKWHHKNVTHECMKYFTFELFKENENVIYKLYKNCLADLEMIINKIFMELTVTISCIALFSLLGSGLNIGLSKMYHAVDYELML